MRGNSKRSPRSSRVEKKRISRLSISFVFGLSRATTSSPSSFAGLLRMERTFADVQNVPLSVVLKSQFLFHSTRPLLSLLAIYAVTILERSLRSLLGTTTTTRCSPPGKSAYHRESSLAAASSCLSVVDQRRSSTTRPARPQPKPHGLERIIRIGRSCRTGDETDYLRSLGN